MSQPIFPLAVWQSGTNENSIPANDNALRVEVLMGPALGYASAAPLSPSDGDQYVIGTAWDGFVTNNVVIYKGGTWLEFEVFDGWVKTVSSDLSYFDGSAWVVGGSGGGVSSVNGKTGAVVINSSEISAPVRTETASYTAALADAVIQMDSATANNLTIPPNSEAAYPVGRFIEVWQQGVGQTTIVAGSGVTIRKDQGDSFNLKGQDAGCSLRKVGPDTWRLVGNMEAV